MESARLVNGEDSLPAVCKTVLAVDAMGGDIGPSVVVPGALNAARDLNAKILLVGIREKIEEAIAAYGDCSGIGYEIVPASQTIEMTDKPGDALRGKKDSSLHVACRLVKEGRAGAVISAGNSGACVACGMFILGRLPYVERPALATFLPTEDKPSMLLDVGANVDCKAYQIFQFGLMGATFFKNYFGFSESPKLGLLSIGEEEGKGNQAVKEAYGLLRQSRSVNFVGNVEGRDLFSGKVQVIACDGFVGNVALKVSEGLAGSLFRIIKKELSGAGPLTKFGAMLSKGALRNVAKAVDASEYGGAPLLGLRNLFIVCHGASDSKAITSACSMAARYIGLGIQDKLAHAIAVNDELILAQTL